MGNRSIPRECGSTRPRRSAGWRPGPWYKAGGTAPPAAPILIKNLVVAMKTPEIHKRMMPAATLAVAFAAAMPADGFAIGRAHPANVVSAVVTAVVFPRILFGQSAAWLPVGHAGLAPFV